ncbi:hypothetical protein PC111_g21799 [Phytophthora cactorum]|nr:hypothetical protein PC111_g21799 [Phytophthora cactorum]KAG2807033.1 hypothetical protein PC112_g17593 [Phytophthora cactorum]KAG3156921.1 hypothetical protein PC128_g21762 [Phytophthora cactorum]KAG4042488.1 hypothetical protein PC123_g22025 [Phytophthora cactorum]
MFPASTASADSTDDGSALGEAIAALEAAGAESSPDGTDDSDFEEGKSKLPRVGTRDESGSSESAFMVKLSGDTADESMVDKRDGEEEAEVLSSGSICPDADYTVNIGSAATATVTSGRTASTYEVDTARSHCSKCNYETVIPPMHFFSTRLIVHSPVNNITEGEVSPGGLRQVSCGPLPSDKALSSSSKYIDAKALAEKIVDRIALQSTPTYRVALQWLQDFYEARNAGTVVGFTQREDTLFPGLSQESSQVLGPSDGEQPSTKVEEQGDIHADNQVNQEDLNGGKDAEAEKKSTERAEKDDEPNETKNAPKTQKNQSDSEKKSGVVTWKFADRPLVNGMTKAQRKRAKAKAKENHLLARALAAK